MWNFDQTLHFLKQSSTSGIVYIYLKLYIFILQHPGGADIMLEYAGHDASTAFRSSGHSRMAVKALDRFLVGELPLQERMYRRPGGIRLSDIPE